MISQVSHPRWHRGRSLPWDLLIERLKEVEVETPAAPKRRGSTSTEGKPHRVTSQTKFNAWEKKILSYLNERGFRMASFEKLRKHIDSKITDELFEELIETRPNVFRRALLRGRKRESQRESHDVAACTPAAAPACTAA